MKTEHTPTPWVLSDFGKIANVYAKKRDSNLFLLANVPIADARFIILAVNNFEAMREALTDIQNRADRIRENNAVVGIEAFYIRDKARAVLSAIKQEQNR